MDAYIKVYGLEKWRSLTDQQKHDMIMHLVTRMNEGIDRLNAPETR